MNIILRFVNSATNNVIEVTGPASGLKIPCQGHYIEGVREGELYVVESVHHRFSKDSQRITLYLSTVEENEEK